MDIRCGGKAPYDDATPPPPRESMGREDNQREVNKTRVPAWTGILHKEGAVEMKDIS